MNERERAALIGVDGALSVLGRCVTRLADDVARHYDARDQRQRERGAFDCFVFYLDLICVGAK